MTTIPAPQEHGGSSPERFSTASFYLSPKSIVQVLGLVICGLTIASVAGQFAKYVLGYTTLGGLIPLFDLNLEQNIPTWYSSAQLLLCAIFLWMIAWATRNDGDRAVWYWGILAIILLGLSLDETAGLHELIGKRLRSILRSEGVLRYPWVIPGAVFVLIFIVAYMRFFIKLPPKIRRLIGMAGTIYVWGALGMELIEGYYASLYSGQESMSFAILATIEEVCEMTGVLIFMYALLLYISTYIQEVKIYLNDHAPSIPPSRQG
ncbi:MAG: hypothetical protein ACRERE_06275 [Candidatus Entotheonellia bacterium]